MNTNTTLPEEDTDPVEKYDCSIIICEWISFSFLVWNMIDAATLFLRLVSICSVFVKEKFIVIINFIQGL